MFTPRKPSGICSIPNSQNCYQQGQYAEAQKIAEEAVKVAETTFGKDHPNMATSLNNLALLYYSQGKYTEAEPLYKQALSIKEKALGKEHPDVATSLNNLAALYDQTGSNEPYCFKSGE